MPLGWERINVKKTTPNKNIVFLKPLLGPDHDVSKDFLERIAAQCLPIMNKHHLAVVSLEEYEPNEEFWGRNFNNGEVIQLVLKSPATGRFLPFKFVQMVMIHELAHNKQMNHSKTFWAVRNDFSSQMKDLWAQGYTGDGLWGKGMLLDNSVFAREELDPGEALPEHMCGGTFSSRRDRKRKAKPKITYKEQQERRIKKKFGMNGVTLGADEETKMKLEKGKRPVGKPRVAGSARGRELRAAAALSRFETKKEEPQIKDEDLVTDSESDDEDDVLIKTELPDAIDIDGNPLLDPHGQGMVKVCGDEDNNDDDVKREFSDFQSISHTTKRFPPKVPAELKAGKPSAESGDIVPIISKQSTPAQPAQRDSSRSKSELGTRSAKKPHELEKRKVRAGSNGSSDADNSRVGCQVCSVENDPTELTCIVCSHVLHPEFVPNSWRCKSFICSKYINSGDTSRCGLCGTKK